MSKHWRQDQPVRRLFDTAGRIVTGVSLIGAIVFGWWALASGLAPPVVAVVGLGAAVLLLWAGIGIRAYVNGQLQIQAQTQTVVVGTDGAQSLGGDAINATTLGQLLQSTFAENKELQRALFTNQRDHEALQRSLAQASGSVATLTATVDLYEQDKRELQKKIDDIRLAVVADFAELLGVSRGTPADGEERATAAEKKVRAVREILDRDNPKFLDFVFGSQKRRRTRDPLAEAIRERLTADDRPLRQLGRRSEQPPSSEPESTNPET